MDWNDLSLYDLVINGDKLSPDSSAGVIIEAANREGIKTFSLSALKAMGRLSLAKRVEAGFLKNRIDFHALEIEVPEEGVVWIRGSRNPFDSEATLVEVVKQVPGVSEVRCEVKASPMPEI
jgi:hypothetical protein